MTSRKGPFRPWMITVVIALAAGVFFYIGYRQRTSWKKDHVLVELKPIQTPAGWGYDILTDGKIFIHQNVIPAIGGNAGFRTKEDALTVGHKVYERLLKGDVPAVTAKEVHEMGILPNTPSK